MDWAVAVAKYWGWSFIENAIERTGEVRLSTSLDSSPLVKSHINILQSSDPAAICPESQEKASELIASIGPLNFQSTVAFSESHTCTTGWFMGSSPPEATNFEFGEKTAAFTHAEWPWKVNNV